jgi:hypothetical protein
MGEILVERKHRGAVFEGSGRDEGVDSSDEKSLKKPWGDRSTMPALSR